VRQPESRGDRAEDEDRENGNGGSPRHLSSDLWVLRGGSPPRSGKFTLTLPRASVEGGRAGAGSAGRKKLEMGIGLIRFRDAQPHPGTRHGRYRLSQDYDRRDHSDKTREGLALKIVHARGIARSLAAENHH
jgi:hypothetical protein